MSTQDSAGHGLGSQFIPLCLDHRTMQKSSEPSVPGCSESESGRVTAGLDQARSQERDLRLLSSQEKPSKIPSFSWIKRHGRGMDFGFSKPFFLNEGLPVTQRPE